LQGFQSRKLTKTIQTSRMTDFNPLCRQSLYSFFHCHKIYTRTAYSAANLSGALNEQMPAGLLSLAWHTWQITFKFRIGKYKSSGSVSNTPDVKANNLAPTLKIRTAYPGTNTVYTE